MMSKEKFNNRDMTNLPCFIWWRFGVLIRSLHSFLRMRQYQHNDLQCPAMREVFLIKNSSFTTT